MEKFTKGPWVARGNTPSRVYGMQREDKPVIVAACGNVIEQAGANAHLIAAAPEMYEMLLRLKEECDMFYSEFGEPSRDDYEAAFTEIDDLLAKARGES